MDPVLPPSLLKAAAAVASGHITRQLRRRTVRMRVSWAVAREARTDGINVSSAALRGWLAQSDAQEQLRLGTAVTVAAAVRNLAWLLTGEKEQRSRDAEKLLFLLLARFLRAQDPAAATVLAYEWQVEHTHAEGRATREEGPGHRGLHS